MRKAAGQTLDTRMKALAAATTAEGKKMAGLTGGSQGTKGTLFGTPYEPESW